MSMQALIRNLRVSIALIIVGPIAMFVGAAGTIPFGNPQPTISDPALRLVIFAVGTLFSILGAWLAWHDRVLVKGIPDRLSTDSYTLMSKNIANELRKNISWATEALEQARLRPPSQSIFQDRLSHFRVEKEHIAHVRPE